MKVELDKKDLAALVRGTTPNYNLFEHPLVKMSGYYTGGHHDKWTWNSSFEDKLTEDGLWELYCLCKHSWDKSE